MLSLSCPISAEQSGDSDSETEIQYNLCGHPDTSRLRLVVAWTDRMSQGLIDFGPSLAVEIFFGRIISGSGTRRGRTSWRMERRKRTEAELEMGAGQKHS